MREVTIAAEEPRPVLWASRRVVLKWRKRGRGVFSMWEVVEGAVEEVEGGWGSPEEELEEGREACLGLE